MKISEGRPYTEFVYLQNPRTEVKHICRADDPLVDIVLGRFERMGWWAQLKMNGTRSGVYVPPDRNVFSWNRHGEPQRAWRFDEQTSAAFRNVRWHNKRGRQWWMYDGELVHNKTPHIKKVHYLYDILVAHGVHLVRTTYAERYKILEELWPKVEERFGYWMIDQHTWLAKNFTTGLADLYRQVADIPEVEGLVLKDPNGVYYTWDARAWMVKVRFK